MKMEHLPLEILEKILSYKVLCVEDVLNFSSTCSYFRKCVINSFFIWKCKYVEKWSTLLEYISKDCNYFEEVKYTYEIKKQVMTILESMSPRFYKMYQLSDTDLEEWTQLVSKKKLTYYYVVETLLNILNNNESIKSIEVVPLKTPGNKTLQFYARKVLRHIKQLHLSQVWLEYINLPPKQQILEKGATFVAAWCQPELDITDEKIENDLNFISDLVKQKLFSINPNHELFRTLRTSLEEWKFENLDRSQWNRQECWQLINAMREVMYSELGFSGNSENYYLPQNSLINRVLETKKGLPIILAIIYSSIGRRLGLLLEPLNFPSHFLLQFIERHDRFYSVFYIDTFNGGNIIQKIDYPYSASVCQEILIPVATATQVVKRVVKNLELSSRQHIEPNRRVSNSRAILELLVLVTSHDLSAVINLAKLYSLHRINTKKLEENLALQRFNSPDEVHITLAKLRKFSRYYTESELAFHTKHIVRRIADLKFAVGMIMTDIRNNHKCVIYGWNTRHCSTECSTTPWSNCTLSPRPSQPIYYVLTEDGSYQNVHQELLVPSSEAGALSLQEDLGRHFSHFFENHFVPNAEKEKEYPYDSKIRHKYYHETQLSYYKPQ